MAPGLCLACPRRLSLNRWGLDWDWDCGPSPHAEPGFCLGPRVGIAVVLRKYQGISGIPEAGSGARTDFRHECSFLESEDLRPHRELSMSPPGFLELPLCRLSPGLPSPLPPPPFLLFPGPCRWAPAPWVLTHRASARGRIRSQTLGLVPCAPRKFAPARSFLSQLQKLFTWEARIPLRGGRVGAQGPSSTAASSGKHCKLQQIRGAGGASPARD